MIRRRTTTTSPRASRPARDYYKIDTTTGARTLIARRLSRTMGTSPDSQWFLYLENPARDGLQPRDRQGRAGRHGRRRISSTPTTTIAAEKPVWGVAGWSKDGKSVLLNDKYDVWSQPLDGSKGTDLTAGAGARPAGPVAAHAIRRRPAAAGVDAAVAAAAETKASICRSRRRSRRTAIWTKKSGYWRMPAGGGKPAPLIWADKSIGGVAEGQGRATA